MDARILLLALLAGGSETALILTAPHGHVSDAAWGLVAGFCLTLAGTLAAAILGLPRQAWGRRAALGAVTAMLAQGLAAALVVGSWAAHPLSCPAWLYLVAPLLGALGALLGGLVEGAFVDRPASEPGRQMRRGA
jgi:hypothetical protein